MKPKFDLTDGDVLFKVSDDVAYNSKGNMMVRIGDNMAMDIEDGGLHIVADWNSSLFDDDDNDDF